MSAYIVGITGGIACGKTNLTDALRRAGADVVDADEISRALTAAGGRALPGIRALFGDGVFVGDTLDRRALGKIVFSDDAQRKKLESLLHPLIFDEMERFAAGREGAVFWSAPLLYECGMDKKCREVWCAYVPRKEQLLRLRTRDGLSRREALARMDSQWPALKKARLADRVIRTDGTCEESAQQVLALYRALEERLRAGAGHPGKGA